MPTSASSPASSSHTVWLVEQTAVQGLSVEAADGAGAESRTGTKTTFGGQNVLFSVEDDSPAVGSVTLRAQCPLFCGIVAGGRTVTIAGVPSQTVDVTSGQSVVVSTGTTLRLNALPGGVSGASAGGRAARGGTTGEKSGDGSPAPHGRVRSDAANGTTIVVVEVSSPVVQRLLERKNVPVPPIPDGPQPRFHHLSTPPGVIRILASLVDLFSEPPPYRDVLIDLNASELIVRMLRTEAGPLLLRDVPSAAASLLAPDVSDDRLGAALQFACSNLDHHLTVGDLADRACMSESSFYRHFRDELGMTPLEFLTQERMKRARQLLSDRYHTVSEVSHDVGFQSVSYFITTFKEHFGQTPKQYQLSRSDEKR